MRGPPPLLIIVTERQQAILLHLAHCSTAPHALVQRARLIRAAAAGGAANDALARQFGLHRQTVCRWRARWHAAAALLAAQEAADPTAAPLHAFITALLSDAPRCGTPPTFTPEQIVGVVALACEEPQASGYPVSHWTTRDLVTEAVKRGLVPTISPRTVGRFLGSGPITAPSQSLLAQPETVRPRRVRGGGPDGLYPVPGGAHRVGGGGPHGELC